MDINLEKLELRSCRIVREAKAEQSVDCDITLPDYCTDIKSVLSCEIEPNVNATDITGNRITATGNAVVRLTYVGDNDKLSCFEQNYPMSKYVEMSSLSPEFAVVVKAKVSYVNCRAVSPRRVDVHGCVSLLFSAFSTEGVSIVNSAAAPGLELKQLPMKACSCVGCTSKLFEMSEVVPLPESSGSAKAVIHAESFPVITEVRAVADKTLIKGEICLKIAVCNEESDVTVIEHSMPVSRIVELQGIDDSCLCDVQTYVCSPDVRLKTDDSGANTQLDVAVSVSVLLRAYREINFAAIEDAYALHADLESDKVTLNSYSLLKKMNETFAVNTMLDFSSSPVKNVVASWCTDLTCVCGFEDGVTELSGAVTVCVLYEDNGSKPCFAKRRIDYRHSVQTGKAQSLIFDPDALVSSLSLTGSGNEINARIQLTVGGCAFGCETKTVMSDMLINERSAAPSDSAITVYFSDKGEQLWDIAKRFNTSVSAIGRRNLLSSETVEENTMLIIPGV